MASWGISDRTRLIGGLFHGFFCGIYHGFCIPSVVQGLLIAGRVASCVGLLVNPKGRQHKGIRCQG